MWVLVADQGGPGWVPGLAVLCEPGRGLVLNTYFGPFPADGSPVQFMAGRPGSRIERYGPTFRGAGPASGFHDPQVSRRGDALRMLGAAACYGSPVSNGHQSFWNRASREQNARVRAFAERCG